MKSICLSVCLSVYPPVIIQISDYTTRPRQGVHYTLHILHTFLKLYYFSHVLSLLLLLLLQFIFAVLSCVTIIIIIIIGIIVVSDYSDWRWNNMRTPVYTLNNHVTYRNITVVRCYELFTVDIPSSAPVILMTGRNEISSSVAGGTERTLMSASACNWARIWHLQHTRTPLALLISTT